MEPGGKIVLVNATPYKWILESTVVDGMDMASTWNFRDSASVVEPYTCNSVKLVSHVGHGEAKYSVGETGSQFTIVASGPVLQARMDSIETKNAPRGSSVPLGFISDRPSYFVLSGTEGSYHSVGDVANWMQKSLCTIGNRKLSEICVPFSHNAGMSKVEWSTSFAADGCLLTQYVSVEQQLHLGNKFFNFGPLGTWQGGNGEFIQDVIDGVNRFTAASGELIVLSIGHTYAINDVMGSFEEGDFRGLEKHHWNSLLDMFTNPQTGIKALWKPAAQESLITDLTSLPLNTYIGSGSSAVMLVVDDAVDVAGRAGVFNYTCWSWEASAWWKEESGRMDEYREYMARGVQNSRPYIFSGCHMQSDAEAVLTTIGQSSQSVLSLAPPAKHRLFMELFPLCCQAKRYPAALSMDGIDSSDLAALCMAFNDHRNV
ncbi:exo-1,3-beta-D-glucanase [Xylariaceae sp. FL0594]|nr:exo-1,3-beta-D-glucanase [Xylariaceae sp. FL0594]